MPFNPESQFPEGIDTDNKDDLLKRLKSIDIAAETGNTFNNLTVKDILDKISDAKLEEQRRKEALKPPKKYVPPGGWKKLQPITDSSLATSTIQRPKKTEDHTIARFHIAPPKWDGSFESINSSFVRFVCLT